MGAVVGTTMIAMGTRVLMKRILFKRFERPYDECCMHVLAAAVVMNNDWYSMGLGWAVAEGMWVYSQGSFYTREHGQKWWLTRVMFQWWLVLALLIRPHTLQYIYGFVYFIGSLLYALYFVTRPPPVAELTKQIIHPLGVMHNSTQNTK